MRRPLGVLVFPVNSNPYQELLHDALTASGQVRIRPVLRYPRLGSLNFVLAALWFRTQGFSVVHLHWPTFDLPNWLDRKGCCTVAVTRLTFWLLRALGYRVVWTVHNLAPHQTESTNDSAVMRLFSRAADVQIVHSERSAAQLRAAGLDQTRIEVIPHGNYIGRYLPSETRVQTRRGLGVDDAEFVFLFLGLVRPYKGVPLLVDAFVHADIPDTTLVIAGKVMDPALRRGARAVSVRDGYVADAELANLMAAADVVCLPFLQVTTSGSALLALSFGKPVIATQVGDLADLPPDAAWFVEAGDRAGLEAALWEAAQTPRSELAAKGAAALDEARQRDWHRIADATLATYRDTTSNIGQLHARRDAPDVPQS